MSFAYYQRFNQTQKRIAHKSDSLSPIALEEKSDYLSILDELKTQLSLGNVAYVERSSQQLVDTICEPLKIGNMRISSVRVHALEQRPYDDWGELHSLYEPIDETRIRARLYVWMRTAKRKQIVAFKTYLRTLVHELCHHLDYEYYRLEDSLHTKGFYQRESSLVKQLMSYLH